MLIDQQTITMVIEQAKPILIEIEQVKLESPGDKEYAITIVIKQDKLWR